MPGLMLEMLLGIQLVQLVLMGLLGFYQYCTSPNFVIGCACLGT
jgi:hypothetical protein